MSGYHPVRSLPLKMETHPPLLPASPAVAASPTGPTAASIVVADVPAPPPEPPLAVIALPAVLPEPPELFDPPAPGVVTSPAAPGEPALSPDSVLGGSLAPQPAIVNAAKRMALEIVVFMILHILFQVSPVSAPVLKSGSP